MRWMRGFFTKQGMFPIAARKPSAAPTNRHHKTESRDTNPFLETLPPQRHQFRPPQPPLSTAVNMGSKRRRVDLAIGIHCRGRMPRPCQRLSNISGFLQHKALDRHARLQRVSVPPRQKPGLRRCPTFRLGNGHFWFSACSAPRTACSRARRFRRRHIIGLTTRKNETDLFQACLDRHRVHSTPGTGISAIPRRECLAELQARFDCGG